jgi:hypothetical protein
MTDSRITEDDQSGSIAGLGKLTEEQIKNWRNVLCATLGPYALIMPDEQVQAFRNKMQSAINSDVA